jgi:hypothetical protein
MRNCALLPQTAALKLICVQITVLMRCAACQAAVMLSGQYDSHGASSNVVVTQLC